MNRIKLVETVTDSHHQICLHYLNDADDEHLMHDTEELIESLLELIPYERKKEYLISLKNMNLIW